MHWKALLTTVIVIGIAGLLLMRFGPEKLLGYLPDFSAFTSFLNPPPPSGNPFPIKLSVDKKSFYGQSYDVSDVSITGSGTCVHIGEMIATMVDFQNDKGNCSLTTEKTNGKIEIKSDVVGCTLDAISLDIIPSDLTISNLNIKKLSLSSVSGKVSRLKANEWVSEPLSGDPLEIDNFIGEIVIDDSSVTLSGYATRVMGAGFSWTG